MPGGRGLNDVEGLEVALVLLSRTHVANYVLSVSRHSHDPIARY